jgi:hypothetical protein
MAIAISNSLNSSTVFNSNLSFEGVITGAFFPQSDLEVPEKIMPEHTGQDMVMPPWEFSHLVLIHSQFNLCFLKALLN